MAPDTTPDTGHTIREFDPAGCGIVLVFAYETDTVLHAEVRESGDGSMGVRFFPRRLAVPLRKRFSCLLGDPWWNGTRCFVCEDEDGFAAGYGEFCREQGSGRARLTNLWVREDARRQGTGRRLVEAVLTAAQKDGARAVVLETQSSNRAAILFYRAMGFTFCGCDLCHYSNDDVAQDSVRLEMVRLLPAAFAPE